MARALIDVAAEAGADVVKFQTYRSRSVYVQNAGTSEYLAEQGVGEDVSALFDDLEMPYEMVPVLAEHCRARGIEFMSTPFSVDDLTAIDPYVARHKIASFEISHVRLLEAVARTGKPVILSTGASTGEEVEVAVDLLQRNGVPEIALLQCTSSYPAPPHAMNLSVIPGLAKRFGVAVGLSDHSRDPTVAPVAAVALGASVIEKHFTLDRRLPGPDHPFAITPDELRDLVRAARLAAAMRGQSVKGIDPAETELREFAHRGVQALVNVAVGDTFAEDRNVAVLRPGNQVLGLHPRFLDEILGRRATRAIRAGEGLRSGDWE